MSLRQVLAAGSASASTSSETSVTELSATGSSAQATRTSDNTNAGAGAGAGAGAASESEGEGENSVKCPVPRPILNIIMKDQRTNPKESVVADGQSPEVRKARTDAQWVEDQLMAFQETYGQVAGYEFAEAYMACILSLATSGVESERVSEVSTS